MLDILGSLTGLVLLSPLLIAVAILIRMTLGKPVLFRQRRPGLNGAPFILIKFRTMTNAPNHHGSIPSDGERLSRVGRWLRSTSLDELPELWNVLRGDMSLVGTRPLLMEYLPLYSPEQARRHDVKPGLTGWTQVNGRNSLTWEEKFKLDIWYVEHRSLSLDLYILALTFGCVFRRRGVSAQGEATMPPFLGGDSG